MLGGIICLRDEGRRELGWEEVVVVVEEERRWLEWQKEMQIGHGVEVG